MALLVNVLARCSSSSQSNVSLASFSATLILRMKSAFALRVLGLPHQGANSGTAAEHLSRQHKFPFLNLKIFRSLHHPKRKRERFISYKILPHFQLSIINLIPSPAASYHTGIPRNNRLWHSFASRPSGPSSIINYPFSSPSCSAPRDCAITSGKRKGAAQWALLNEPMARKPTPSSTKS
jgi:hypothetical protein